MSEQPYLTMADIAALYRVRVATARKWAAADSWRRKGSRPKRYSVADAQASYDRRHAGRTMRHLVNLYGARETEAMDIAISADSEGDFGSIETAALGATGRDGYGKPTPTVRELIAILRALPEQCMDLPVGRYADEGITGLQWDTSFPREQRDDVHTSTRHVQLW